MKQALFGGPSRYETILAATGELPTGRTYRAQKGEGMRWAAPDRPLLELRTLFPGP